LLSEAVRELSDDPKVLNDFAWAAYSQGHISEAKNLMRRVVELTGESEQSHDAKLFLEITALDNGPVDPAAQVRAEQILQASPGYVPALMLRAQIRAQSGELDPETVYSEILARFPDFVPAQKKLASLYLRQPNRHGQAYSLAAKARKTLPDDPELAQILAEASYQKMEFAYAIRLLEQSATQRPLDAKQLYILGKSHFNTKDKSRSREALDQALNSGLPGELAEDAKRTIKELGK
jgi:predicted Zn-dependent protease